MYKAAATDPTENPARLTSCEGLRARRFSPLPASRREAERVFESWRTSSAQGPGNTQLLEGRAASERAFRALSSGRRVLHVATHGFSLQDDCEAWNPAAERLFRTLFRSGLALAGANSRDTLRGAEDDGLLTAGEISTLDLRGTEWVCLSACESGLGEPVRSEGLLGLERAFRLAGVQQVVMSLWPVADETAARWNDAFYLAMLHAGTRNKTGTVEAARSVSLKLLKDRRREGLPTPPSTWACFVVSGVANPR